MTPVYTYRAKIFNVVDGDTVDAEVDLGFGTSQRIRLRLSGVDTPELVGADRADALTAKEWMWQNVAGRAAVIQTTKDRNMRDRKDRWMRYLAVIWIDGQNINEELIAKGLGVRA